MLSQLLSKYNNRIYTHACTPTYITYRHYFLSSPPSQSHRERERLYLTQHVRLSAYLCESSAVIPHVSFCTFNTTVFWLPHSFSVVLCTGVIRVCMCKRTSLYGHFPTIGNEWIFGAVGKVTKIYWHVPFKLGLFILPIESSVLLLL